MKLNIAIVFMIVAGFFFLQCKNANPEVVNNHKEEVVEASKKIDKENDENKEEVDYNKFGISEASISQVKPLEIGSAAPDFTAKDQNGSNFQLSEELKKGDVILVFYRGYWCGYCSRHLAAFSEELEEIRANGANLVVVAPESSQYIDSTVTNTNLDIPYLSDSSNEIMSQYGVAFTVNEMYNQKFTKWNKNTLSEVNGQDEAVLPVPATYIIGKDGKIKWVHFDPNYAKRSDMKEIMNALSS